MWSLSVLGGAANPVSWSVGCGGNWAFEKLIFCFVLFSFLFFLPVAFLVVLVRLLPIFSFVFLNCNFKHKGDSANRLLLPFFSSF